MGEATNQMSSDPYQRRNLWLTWVLVGFLFISPLLYIGVLRDPSDLPRYALLAFSVCLSCIIFTYYLFRGATSVYVTVAMLIAMVFFLLAGVSSLWAVSPSTNLIYVIRLLCYVVLLFLAAQIGSKRSLFIFIIASVLSAGLNALIGLMQNHGLNIFGLRGYTMGGTFTYKNHMALYLDLVIPAGLVLLLVVQSRALRYVCAISLVLCLVYIFNSHTRGSYLALSVAAALGIVFYAFIPSLRNNLNTGISRHKWILLVMLVCVVTASLIPGKGDRYLDRPTYAGDKIDTSTRDRLTAYRNALSLIREKPVLGSGYGSFWKAFRPYTNHPKVIARSNKDIVLYRMHNDLLQIVVELGLVGGILCLLIIGLSYRYAINQLRLEQEPGRQILLFGLLLGLSASLAHSVVDFPLIKPSSAILIWLYLGLISGVYARARSATLNLWQPWIRISAVAIIALSSLLLANYYRTYILGSYYARKAQLSYKNKDCADALKYIDWSENTFKHDFYVHKVRVYIQLSCNRNIPSLYDVLSNELAWDDTNIPALLKRGYILLGSNWFNRAERDFMKVIYLLPHRPEGYVGEAYVLMEKGELDRSRELLKRMQSRFPDNADISQAQKKFKALESRSGQ